MLKNLLFFAFGIMSVFFLMTLSSSYSLILFLTCLFIVSAMILARPLLGLGLTLALTMVFERFFTLQPLILSEEVSLKLYPIDIILIVTILSALGAAIFKKKSYKIHFAPKDLWLLLFIAASAVYFAVQISLGIGDSELAFSTFKNYAFYTLMYFGSIFLIQKRDDYQFLVHSLYVGLAGIVVFIIIGVLRGEGLWTEFTPLSTVGKRLLAFPHAFYSSLLLLLFLGLKAQYTERSRQLTFLMWVLLFGVLGSLMRHLWIALALSACVFIFLQRGSARNRVFDFFIRNGALVAMVVVVLGLLVSLFPLSDLSLKSREIVDPLVSRFQSLAEASLDESARWRLVAWETAKESIVRNPLFGIGFGRDLVINFGNYIQVIPIRDLHNSFLVLIVQMGVVGFAIFTIFQLLLMKEIYLYMKWRGEREDIDYFTTAFIAMYFHFLVAAMFQPYFETNLTGIFFWFICAMMLAGMRISKARVYENSSNK